MQGFITLYLFQQAFLLPDTVTQHPIDKFISAPVTVLLRQVYAFIAGLRAAAPTGGNHSGYVQRAGRKGNAYGGPYAG